eukprot:851003_1
MTTYQLLFLILFTDNVLFCYASHNNSQEYLVGINYFAGWWKPLPNKWHEPWNQSVDWRPLYPQRIPLIGNYNTQATTDGEIIAASNYSIDFFQILYYDNYPTERETNS